MCLTIGSVVLASYDLCWLAPQCGVSVVSTNVISLVVGGTEDEVTCETERKNGQSLRSCQVGWVACKILNLKSIERWQKSGVSPGEHESEVVMADIYRSGVPVLIEEEIDHVDKVENGDDDHGCSHMTKLLVLVSSKGKVTIEG